MGFEVADAAWKRDTPAARASSMRALREVLPIPLAGLLTMRLKDSSSLGFTASLKYAIISFTSALSKKEFPE